MTKYIIDNLLEFCNGNLTLLIILLSILPLLELRIAIPFALSTSLNTNPFSVFTIAVSSTLIAIPLILLLLKPIMKLLSKIKFLNKLSISIENYFSSKANDLNKNSIKSKPRKYDKIENSSILNNDLDNDIFKENKIKHKIRDFWNRNRIYFYLFLFVALPFPLTGYYTGSAIAVFLNLNFYKSSLSIFFGNVVAGIIITFFSSLFENSAIYILIIFLILIIVSILIKLLRRFCFNKKKQY